MKELFSLKVTKSLTLSLQTKSVSRQSCTPVMTAKHIQQPKKSHTNTQNQNRTKATVFDKIEGVFEQLPLNNFLTKIVFNAVLSMLSHNFTNAADAANKTPTWQLWMEEATRGDMW